MAFGKNQIFIAVGVAGALYYGYAMSEETPAPKTGILEQTSAVKSKLEEARQAQAAREQSLAQQTSETNLNSTAEGAPSASPMPKLANAAAPSPSPSPSPTPSASPRPPTKEDNDRLLSLVRGVAPANESRAEAPPKRPEPPKRLALVDSNMQHRLSDPAPPKRSVDRTERNEKPRPCKKVPSDQVLTHLKKEARSGLGSFTEKWMERHGECPNELVTFAADTSQEMGMRYFSLKAALEVGGRSSADAVAKLLKDKNAGLRCISLLGMSEMGDRDLAEHFIPMLNDPAMIVRECALTATVRAQGSESLKHVVAVISDPKNYVKGHPLAIVKHSFDLLDAMGSAGAQEACNGLRERMPPQLFSETSRKWAVCMQSVEGGLTPTAVGR